MKKLLQISCFTAVFIVWGLSTLNAFAAEPEEVVIKYFDSLRDGNVETVKRCITGKLYEKRKALLENNSNYPLFLQQFYQGTTVQIINTTTTETNSQVDVEIKFQDGSSNFISLILIDAGNQNWEISDELLKP
jgi:hypothetical protein